MKASWLFSTFAWASEGYSMRILILAVRDSAADCEPGHHLDLDTLASTPASLSAFRFAPPKRSSTAGAQCFTQNGGTRGISGRVNWEQGPYPGVCGESCRHNRCGRCFQRSFCG